MTNLQIQRNPFQIEQTQKLTREKQKTNQNVRQRRAQQQPFFPLRLKITTNFILLQSAKISTDLAV
ncbi:hypothetical protein DSCO28_67160 [Desulfosarcina ovata subsp. sediminis]|uniref:Uncharacterized protein n=1 Tax=Desulfosarcina ovata subsp. sediminis TaxID=885957 RepID=A0A5K8A1F3_9BACT|nr:hypothetical protein DSCO28_67160 [Desulfosarcina ovata subsp. sediminis]